MKSAPALIVALATVVLVAACGGSGKQKAAGTQASSSAIPFDRAFIDAMVPHHRSAIEMAKAANARGLESDELKRIADDIIASQQQEIDQMLDWRDTWFGSRALGPVNPDVLGVPETEMGMSAMSGMSHEADQITKAKDVDATFAQLMIPHHEGAVAMAEAARERGQHEEIRGLATTIVAAQKREIELFKKHSGGAHD